MKIWLIAASLFCPGALRAAEPATAPPVADKVKLRAELRLAYAKSFSFSEALIGADKGYDLACSDENSTRTLIMLEKILEPAFQTKNSIAGHLATAGTSATRDAAAHETAVALVNELNGLPNYAAKATARAKACLDMVLKRSGADDSEEDLFKWDGPLMHSRFNFNLFSGIDFSAELKAAQALVEKTK